MVWRRVRWNIRFALSRFTRRVYCCIGRFNRIRIGSTKANTLPHTNVHTSIRIMCQTIRMNIIHVRPNDLERACVYIGTLFVYLNGAFKNEIIRFFYTNIWHNNVYYPMRISRMYTHIGELLVHLTDLWGSYRPYLFIFFIFSFEWKCAKYAKLRKINSEIITISNPEKKTIDEPDAEPILAIVHYYIESVSYCVRIRLASVVAIWLLILCVCTSLIVYVCLLVGARHVNLRRVQ